MAGATIGISFVGALLALGHSPQALPRPISAALAPKHVLPPFW